MKNENVIIALIFLAIVALFAFNFNKLTGFTAAETDDYAPTVNVYRTDFTDLNKEFGKKTTINSGEKIDIEIKINKGCVRPEIEIYPVRVNYKGETIIGTRANDPNTNKYSPDIGDCARVSDKGAKIPCGSSKYCQGDLKEDLMKNIIKTQSDWKGNYIIRVNYYDEKRKEKYTDSEEFIIN